MTPNPRRSAFAAPVDALAAAVRLEYAADAMRAEQLERGRSDEPPTGLLDLAAIRAALGGEPGGEVNPAAARWLAGEDEPAPVTGECGELLPVVGFEDSRCYLPTGHAGPHADEDGETEWSNDPEPVDVVDVDGTPWVPFDADPELEHTHPYFVEGCAECVERAEQLEALEDDQRSAERAERAGLGAAAYAPPKPEPEPEPEPVEVPPAPAPAPAPGAGPPAPAPPVEPEASPVPAPVPAVTPSTPAPVVDVMPAVFSSEHRPLTWRSRHDPRSLEFSVRRGLAGSAPLTDHVWPTGPVLDQGAEGACVGYAIVDAVNVDDPLEHPVLTGADAARLYKRAQQLDEVPGENYTGTSVLAGMQAAVEAGLFGGYVWAFGTRDVAQAVLQRGPVVVGVPWLSGMYDTGPGGLVQLTGEDTGAGHCLAVVGIKIRGPQGQLGPFFVWQNSWGPGYGDKGLGYIHHRDLATLLHGVGEAAIPTAGPQHV